MTTALTRLSIDNLSEPICGGIVDGFCNVEAEVKSTMICSTKNNHNLMLFVF